MDFPEIIQGRSCIQKEMPINWCPSCKCGLANEEVVNGVCERCGAPVIRKVKSEWMLKITDYAEKLIEGLNDVTTLNVSRFPRKTGSDVLQVPRLIFRSKIQKISCVFTPHAAIHCLVLPIWLFHQSIHIWISTRIRLKTGRKSLHTASRLPESLILSGRSLQKTRLVCGN